MTTALNLATLIPQSSFYASSSTTATFSINVLGGAAGSLHYQTANGQTAMLPIGGNGTLLQSNGLVPAWQTYTGTSQIAGGNFNTIVYQSAPNTTGFITAPSTAGTSLQWNGSAFAWGNPTASTSIAGGLNNQLLYQVAAGNTGFVTAPTTASTYLIWGGTSFSWTPLPQTIAASLAGGSLNTIPFQAATSSTTFIPSPSTASTYLFWSGSAFTYTNVTYIPSLGVGIGADGIQGNIRATGSLTVFFTSDKVYKENIVDIPDALNIVNAIGGKLFDWSDAYINKQGGEDGYFVQKQDYGVIAQDVQRVFPRAVRQRTDGTLALNYEKMCALAFAAIKELSDKVDKLTGAK
jgi:hypothetical protein